MSYLRPLHLFGAAVLLLCWTSGLFADQRFIHRASATNSARNVTYLNNPAVNGNPSAVILITPNLARGAVNDSPVGVAYDQKRGLWLIFNETQQAIPAGAEFNVAVFPASDTNTGAFRFLAAPQPESNLAQFSAALADGQPNWITIASQAVTPGSQAVLNPNPIGVRYLTTANQWAVFNEKAGRRDPNPRAMPVGATFNVGLYQYGPGASLGEWSSTAAASGNVTVIPINIPLFNNRPDAILLVTTTIEYVGPGP